MKKQLKRAAKQTLKTGYHLIDWALPGRVRRELRLYRQFRRTGGHPPPLPVAAPRPIYGGPYWERREAKGASVKPVRVGMVGAGNYAQFHLDVLSHLEAVTVTGLLTTGSPRGLATAARFQIPLTATDRGAFLARDDIDCFVVVASAEHLFSLVTDCLATGKPVLLEKPPGSTAAETAQLAHQAEAHRTFGMVCMNRRFYSVLEHGLAALALCGPIRGALLEFPHGFTRDRQSRRLSDWDYDHFYVRNTIHGIDLIRYILGDPQAVHSLTWPNTEYHHAAASYSALLEYDRGVVASVVDLWDTPVRWRLKVVAESGSIEFEPLETGWYLNDQLAKVALASDPVDREFRTGVYAQDLHFIDAVRRGVMPARPACLLPDAYRTMQLVEQILASNLHPNPISGGGPAAVHV